VPPTGAAFLAEWNNGGSNDEYNHALSRANSIAVDDSGKIYNYNQIAFGDFMEPVQLESTGLTALNQALPDGTSASHYASAVSADGAVSVFSNTHATDRLIQYDASMVEAARGFGQIGGSLTISLEIIAGGTVIVTGDTNTGKFQGFAAGSLATAIWTFDPVLDPSAPFRAATIGFGSRAIRASGDQSVWLTPNGAANNNHFVYRVSASGALLTELDPSLDSGLAAGINDKVIDIEVDKVGHLYVLFMRTIGGNRTADVIRYDAVGSLVYSSAAKGINSFPFIPSSIAVDDAGNVYVGDEQGDISVMSQT